MSEATTTAYQLKSDPNVIVKAVQFDPHEHPWPDGVISWDGKPRPRDMSWGYVELPQKREHVFTGDYIVLDQLGNPYPIRSILFEQAYRPAIVLAQEILDIAQSGLRTGGAWSVEDRMGVLTDALEDISKLCKERLKKE